MSLSVILACSPALDSVAMLQGEALASSTDGAAKAASEAVEPASVGDESGSAADASGTGAGDGSSATASDGSEEGSSESAASNDGGASGEPSGAASNDGSTGAEGAGGSSSEGAAGDGDSGDGSEPAASSDGADDSSDEGESDAGASDDEEADSRQMRGATARATAASGTYQDISYSIASDGAFTIWPTSGDSATLTLTGDLNETPWSTKTSSITSFRVSSGTVYLSGVAALFAYCDSMTTCNLSGLDTSNVTSMDNMFSGCHSLKSITGISSLNTSNVTSMYCTFHDCYALTSLNLSNWDTSNVTSMSNMFAWCSKLTSLNLSNWDTSNVVNTGSMFMQCSSLESITGISSFNTSNVSIASFMFSTCSSLKALDVSKWSTSNMTSMHAMFSGCTKLTALDVSAFDTSSVTEMRSMFKNCTGLTSLDLSSFDTSNVTKMNEMFSGCTSLESISIGYKWGYLTASNTPVEAGVATNNMFADCTNLDGWNETTDGSKAIPTSVGGYLTLRATYSYELSFDANCGKGDSVPASLEVSDSTSDRHTFIIPSGNPTRTNCTFYGWNTKADGSGASYAAGSSIILANSEPGTTKAVTLYAQWRGNTYGAIQWAIDDEGGLDIWPTSGGFATISRSQFSSSDIPWANYRRMITSFEVSSGTVHLAGYAADSFFSGWESMTSCDVSGLDTSKLSSFTNMFYNCSSLKSIEGLTSLNTSNAAILGGMFYGCSALESLDVSSFDVSNAWNLFRMFEGCSSLESITGLDSWSTTSATSMRNMFANCSALTSLDVSGFDTSKVTMMASMFEGCSALTELDLSSFNTASATEMNSLLSGCSALESITGLSGFNTANVTKMESMFEGCSALESLNLASFDIAKVTDMSYMFSGCSSLKSILIDDKWGYLTAERTPATAGVSTADMFADCTNLDGWNETTDGSKAIPTSAGGYLTLKTVTYSYELSFDANGGDADSVPATQEELKSYSDSHTFTISGDKPTHTGWTSYTFAGWNTAADGTGASYAAGSSIILANSEPGTTKAVTLYAQWRGNTYGAIQWAIDDEGGLDIWPTSGNSATLALDQYGYKKIPWANYRRMITSFEVSSGTVCLAGKAQDFFNGCSVMTSCDVSGLDVSNVTSMRSMFQDCPSLTSLDLSSFNVAKVTDMISMFCGCEKLERIYISDRWGYLTADNTPADRGVGGLNMFANCKKLPSWDSSFADASRAIPTSAGGYLTLGGLTTYGYSLAYNANGGEGAPVAQEKAGSTSDSCTFTVTSVDPERTGYAFTGWNAERDGSGASYAAGDSITLENAKRGTTVSATIYAQWTPISYTVAYDGNGADSGSMSSQAFAYDVTQALTANGFTKDVWTFSGWNTAADGSGAAYAEGEEVLNLTAEAGATVTLYAQWGPNAYGDIQWVIDEGALSVWPSNGTSATLDLGTDGEGYASMPWRGYKNADPSDEGTGIGSFEVPEGKGTLSLTGNASNLFEGYSDMESFDGSGLDTSGVTDMSGMFEGCGSMEGLDLSGWDTSNVTTMDNMFKGCGSLSSLDASSLDTSGVTDMSGMFEGCGSMEGLDLSGWDTSNVTTMDNMFKGCTSLATITVGEDWSTDAVTSSDGMFQGCTSLPGYSEGAVDASHASAGGYLTSAPAGGNEDGTGGGNGAGGAGDGIGGQGGSNGGTGNNGAPGSAGALGGNGTGFGNAGINGGSSAGGGFGNSGALGGFGGFGGLGAGTDGLNALAAQAAGNQTGATSSSAASDTTSGATTDAGLSSEGEAPSSVAKAGSSQDGEALATTFAESSDLNDEVVSKNPILAALPWVVGALCLAGLLMLIILFVRKSSKDDQLD